MFDNGAVEHIMVASSENPVDILRQTVIETMVTVGAIANSEFWNV